MQVFLIKELDKSKLFGQIMIKEDKILIKKKVNKMNLPKKIKLIKKINKVLKVNNSNKVIISKELKKEEEFINLLYSNGIDIIQGKYLFKAIIEEFLENICIKNNLKKQDVSIGITVNDVNEWVVNLIEKLSTKFKMINVVTKKANYFKNIQKRLYDENGIIITITNNKKKALSKADIVLNIDFPEEIINKYNIKDDGIIINLEEKVKIKKKRFNGKIINDYEIKIKENTDMYNVLLNQEYKDFDIKDLVEIYTINNPEETENIIIK